MVVINKVLHLWRQTKGGLSAQNDTILQFYKIAMSETCCVRKMLCIQSHMHLSHTSV